MITITPEQTKSIITLIDIASARGAFRGAEMLSIGTLHKELTTKLQKEEPAPDPIADKEKVSIKADVKKEV